MLPEQGNVPFFELLGVKSLKSDDLHEQQEFQRC